MNEDAEKDREAREVVQRLFAGGRGRTERSVSTVSGDALHASGKASARVRRRTRVLGEGENVRETIDQD